MVLQRVCFERTGVAPNERLIGLMDRLVREGRPSARVKIGKGWELVNRYEQAAFVPVGDGGRAGKPPGSAGPGEPVLKVEEKGKVTPAQARRIATSGGKEYFDAAGIGMPLSVRPLRAGDRIRPFGLDAEKKVKEILIDRKIPRDERWGRPVVCDAGGNILWIPGVVRSAHAPIGPKTKKTVLLKLGREPGRK
jgi:tRNA(Ile)-lysidine synthase